MLKKLRNIFLWLLASIVVVVAAATTLVYVYEDEIKNAAVARINQYINTPVKVGHISFSVIEHFPYCSVIFPDVEIMESGNTGVPLLKAKEIALLFNFWDIYSKQYNVKKLVLTEGFAQLKQKTATTTNYDIIKKTDTAATTDNFKLNLEIIELENFGIAYRDIPNKQIYDFRAKEAVINGQFTAADFDLALEGDLTANMVSIDGTEYLRSKNISAKLLVNVNNSPNATTTTIKRGELKLNNLALNITGNVATTPDANTINLHVNGSRTTLQALAQLLPLAYGKYLKNYESAGNFYFVADIVGKVANGLLPQITVKAGVKNGSITVKQPNMPATTLSSITTEINYTNGAAKNNSTSVVNIPSFNAMMGQNAIVAKVRYSNFDNPFIHLELKGQATLAEALAYSSISAIKDVGGSLAVDAKFDGLLKDFKNKATIKNTQSEGSLKITDASFEIIDSKLKCSGFNADLIFKDKDLAINNFSGEVGESDFNLNGTFNNLIAYFLVENQPLSLTANLRSNNLDLNQLLISKGSTNADTNYRFAINADLQCKLNADVKKLTFQKFTCTSMYGTLLIFDQQLRTDRLSFNTMKGQCVVKMGIDASPKTQMPVNVEAAFQNIDIQDMFVAFDNFGQITLTDKNLKGRLSSTSTLSMVIGKDLKINPKNLFCRSKILIENGELNNFEPMYAVAKYIDLNELKSIKFAALQNEIVIENGIITIPAMDIVTNALTLNLSGTHTFENIIDYKMRILLADIMVKKSRKLADAAFGELEDGGEGRTSIFLKMYGPADNPTIVLDKNAVKEKLKNDLVAEKQEIKILLKEEFSNIFNKNKTTTDANNEGAEWENDIPKPKIVNTTTNKSTTPVEKKKTIDKIKERLKQPVEDE